MKKGEKLLLRLQSKHFQNWSFSDAVTLVNFLGFTHQRTAGSHQIFTHPKMGMLNLQNKKGQAKAYQLKQLFENINQADQ